MPFAETANSSAQKLAPAATQTMNLVMVEEIVDVIAETDGVVDATSSQSMVARIHDIEWPINDLMVRTSGDSPLLEGCFCHPKPSIPPP